MSHEFSKDITRNQYAETKVREAIRSIFPSGTHVSVDGCIIVNPTSCSWTNVLYFQDTFEKLYPQNYANMVSSQLVHSKETTVQDLVHSGSGRRKSKKPVRLNHQQQFFDSTIGGVYDKIGALNLSLKEAAQPECHHLNIPDENSSYSPSNLNFGDVLSSTANVAEIEISSLISQDSNINTPYKKPLKAKRRIFNRFNRSNSDVTTFPRNFTCNQCKEIYTSLSALGHHTIQVHKYYRCVICSAQFTQRSNLQRHSLKHVGFKPFVCKLCHKAYYRKDHLMRHLEMSHHNADPLESIEVKLTYSECLDYIDQYVLNKNSTPQSNHSEQNKTVSTVSSSGSEALSFKWESPSSSTEMVQSKCESAEKMDVIEISPDFSNTNDDDDIMSESV